MTLSGLLGFILIIVFIGLMLFFAVIGRNRPEMNRRNISAFSKLRRAIGLAVEAGSRLHISIGRGGVIGTQSASALVGISMLEKLSSSASTGDKPPIVTSGEGALGILSQDTLRGTYQRIGLSEQFDPTSGQVVGLTPFSYAAGTLALASDDKTGANLLAGNFGSEVALITDAGDRSDTLTLAGTDNLPAQSILFATAHEPLIGEELYAGGAYLDAGPMHQASLQAQDIIRWVVVVVILLGVVANIFGLDEMLLGFFGGIL